MATVMEEAGAVVMGGAGEEEVVAAPEKVEEVKEAGAGGVDVEVAGGEAKKAEEEQGEQGKGTEKKPRSRKPRSAGPHHPPYFEMIKEAIMAAGDGKAGASAYAIAKRVGERHGEVLATQLRGFAAKGRLVRVKASFRLAPAEEKKALQAATPKSKKRTTTAKKTASKNVAPAPARAKRAKKANKASA
ncbi:histone H1-like [Triticum dicoccoides]|uniref:histone H1-like n=1 Tax=Triticum dicoccoides TaxID=85692 RepID=UPI0018911D53|nr:histone H1-like [Triticum dicoccoides]